MIVGIPAIALILQTLVFLPLNFLLGLDEATTTLQGLLSSVVSLLLLAVSYLRVRRLGREYLALLWGYVIILSAIGSVALGAVYIGGIEYPAADPLSVIGRNLLIFGLAEVPRLLALLWFARQASRLSLTHAFFLVAYTSYLLVAPVQGSTAGDDLTSIYLPLLVGGAIGLSVMLLKVWLLGNFDLRGPEFRRNAVIGLVAAAILSGYVAVLIGELIGYSEGPYLNILPLLDVVIGIAAFVATTAFQLAVLFGLFALVYLVRVRVSAADARSDGAG